MALNVDETLEKLKKKRKVERSNTTKLMTKIDTALSEDNIDELEDHLAVLLEKAENLKKLDSEIERLISIDILEEEVELSGEYQENIVRYSNKIKRNLRKREFVGVLNTTQNFVTSQPTNVLNNSMSSRNSVKLPKIVIKPFSGDPKYWNEFWNSFESTIDQNDSLSKTERFTYLKTYLTGTALNAVSGFELSDTNYDNCVKLLKDRFGRKDLLINSFMNKILKLQCVKYSSNVFGLRKLYDELDISIRNLDSLQVDSKSYGPLLIPILLNLLPEDLVLEFNRKKISKESSNVSELLSFLKNEIECREASNLLTCGNKNNLPSQFENIKFHNKRFSRNIPTASSFNAVDNRACIFCDKFHHSFSCDKSIKEKLYKLRNENRCYNCFNKFHLGKFCRNRTNCVKCGLKSHHESICTNNSNRNKTRTERTDSNQTVKESTDNARKNSASEKFEIPTSQNEHTLSVIPSNVTCNKSTLLQTCSVLAHHEDKMESTNLILDCGATRSFIHVSLAEKLNLKIVGEERLSIYSFGMKFAEPKTFSVVEFFISDCEQKNKIKVKCLVSDHITNAQIATPSKTTLKSMRKHAIRIAEVAKGFVEILIGSDYFWNVVSGEKILLGKEIYAIGTIFGWMPAGLQSDDPGIISQNSAIVNFSTTSVHESLRSLWSLDLMGLTDDVSGFSDKEREIMECFENEIQFENNRYSVGLLWNSDARELENNFAVALRRFKILKKRLIENPEIFQQYKNVIEEQIREGIVEECSQEITESSYFMPHREIIKSHETTSCRIVFDASSSRAEGIKSLNDFLDIGPSLSPLVLDIILKFRKFEIAFNGDIAKAFLMIEILEKDRKYLKFLWFGDNEDEYKILRFRRLVFGLRCSPAILSMLIKFHIKGYKGANPESYEMLNSSMYVDDLYYGSDTIRDACRLSSDAVKTFKEAGMNLRKLRSNSEELNSFWIANGYDVGINKESKLLGMIWTPETDKIKINCESLGKYNNSEGTKRIILQTLASVYDPIGVSQPFLMRMKILLQKIWTLGLDWDETLPQKINSDWMTWRSELNVIEKISLYRKYFSSCKKYDVSLHVFADASPRAYGCVAYFRYLDEKHNACTSFIAAKGRVAPLKPTTLPRLELMAALVAARLSKYLTGLLPELCQHIFLWSDSQIAIHWIKGCARNWKPFVSNRVSEIQSLSDPERWFHCAGKDNPADLLSRGESAFNLVRSTLWLQGPIWLTQPEESWPLKSTSNISEEIVASEKKSKSLNILQVSADSENTQALLDINRFSRLKTLLHVTAWILRFVNNTKSNSSKMAGPLTASEINSAEAYWVRVTQKKHYEKELTDLAAGKKMGKTSTISSLNPEIDDIGLLRLKGRIQFSSCSYNEKHPWLLPAKDKLTELLIIDSHEKVLHCGVDATLVNLRERYWIVKGRQRVKSVLHDCLLCKRFNSRPGVQEVAPLPPDRILESPPFAVTGLDFAGPFFTKENGDKHYLLLFTCAVTRALHLEVVPSMSTQSFLLAFRRFISRRGLCSKIYSDNAKSFKKANSELQKLWKSISHPSVKELFASYNIQWIYNVEKGAWWGGFWERMIRTIKLSLRKIVGRSSLSLNELETVFVEIEAMINSRPITYVYDEPTEPSPLSPSHFLIGKRLLSLPASRINLEDLCSRNSLVKKFKHQQHVLNQFWRRWRTNYLLTLRTANICQQSQKTNEFKVDDVVLIHDDRYPRNIWQMGKILQVFPGRDGKIRSCLIKTPKGTIKRPIQLLYNLEINN